MMREKQTIGEVVASVLTAVAGVLLFPVVAPYVMWTNARAYADRYAWVPGIRAGGGVVSGVATLGYVAVLVVVLGGASIAATGGDVPIGGSSIGPAQQTPTATPTPTPQPTPATTIPDETPEPTPTPNPRVEKYETFMYQYATDLQELDNITIRDWSVDAQNETAYVTYEMPDPRSDKAVGNERENVTLGYSATVELYHKDNEEWDSVDGTYIPETIYVRAVTAEGVHYETGTLEYEWAREEMNGEISLVEFVLNYYGSLEYGPANPQYTETMPTTEARTATETTQAPSEG